MLKSWELTKNPWTCHGLASVCLLKECREEAIQWVLRGLEMEYENVSFLKENVKILSLCEASREIVDFMEQQNPDIRQVGKLKFYYISALHKLGEDKKAYELLEKDGGLVIDDIREGEDSIAKLWSELHEKLYSEKAPVPYRYDFKAF